MPKQKVENVYYTFHYRPDFYGEGGKASGVLARKTVALPNVRSLAKHLNKFILQNPRCKIFVVYVSDETGVKMHTTVKFLGAEYRAQRFLTGHKERLLAYAVENGYNIKWNHGLKTKEDIKHG